MATFETVSSGRTLSPPSRVIDGGGGGFERGPWLLRLGGKATGVEDRPGTITHFEIGLYFDLHPVLHTWCRTHGHARVFEASLPSPGLVAHGGQKTQPEQDVHVHAVHRPRFLWTWVRPSWQGWQRPFTSTYDFSDITGSTGGRSLCVPLLVACGWNGWVPTINARVGPTPFFRPS